MKTYFQIARPIWGKGHEDELNSSLFFVVALPRLYVSPAARFIGQA